MAEQHRAGDAIPRPSGRRGPPGSRRLSPRPQQRRLRATASPSAQQCGRCLCVFPTSGAHPRPQHRVPGASLEGPGICVPTLVNCRGSWQPPGPGAWRGRAGSSARCSGPLGRARPLPGSNPILSPICAGGAPRVGGVPRTPGMGTSTVPTLKGPPWGDSQGPVPSPFQKSRWDQRLG